MPQAPDFLETFSWISRAIVFVVMLVGLGLALARTAQPTGVRLRIWLIVVLTMLVWFAVVDYLGRQGTFLASTEVTVPAIPFAVILPIAVGLLLLFRSGRIAELIDATPLSWLVGIQAYRVLGGIFLVLWGLGLLPGQFAIPAGVGDVLVGVLAIAVAIMIASSARGARQAAIGWNVLGIADLIVALVTGFLTSPGRFQLLAHDLPNELTTAYPLVLIPAYAVPLSLILHGLCIWKLRRLSRQAASPSPAINVAA